MFEGEENDPRITQKKPKLSYKRRYDSACDQFADHAIGNVKVSLYKYKFTPTIKAIVIDEREFFFGWFPLGGVASNIVCFHISYDGPKKLSPPAVRCLLDQITKIRGGEHA